MGRRNFQRIAITAAVLLTSLAAMRCSQAQSVNVVLCTVKNPNNPADPATGNGSVGYNYCIGKFDVTGTQYTAFLNAVASSDPYGLYNSGMATAGNGSGESTDAGISQSGKYGSYSYSVIGDSGNDPVTSVTWLDAARFCNWLQNGQPTNLGEAEGSTETGAYSLNGDTTSGLETRNPGSTWWIPSQDEWYKAAYYDPQLNGGTGGYWIFATQSNTAPGNAVGDGVNQANYYAVDGYSVTQSTSYDESQNYLTPVGSFTDSPSYYGTFDQNGDAFQWDDALIDGGREIRGGDWDNDSPYMESYTGIAANPTTLGIILPGFRVASVVPSSPVISSTLSATGTNGLRFRYRITASNNPTSFGATGLPKGLSVNTSTGLISGKPTESGTFAPIISATNPGGTGAATLSLVVITPLPPMISSTLSATGTAGFSFRYQIEASNVPTSFGATGLPKGLSVNKSTGLISGDPSVTGTFAPAISAANAGGTDSELLSLTILPTPPLITSPLTAVATNGLAFNYQITARNKPVSFNASGLPSGLSIDTSTGLISGTVTTNGKFAVSISAINTGGTGSRILTLTVDFNGVKGTYECLIDGKNTGLFTLALSPKGGFTGKLTLAGARYPFAGTLTSEGTFSGTMRAGAATLDVALNIDTSVPEISGTITVSTTAGILSYEVETSLLGTFNATTLPPGLTGRYTVVIPALSGTDPTIPNGSGYGTMTVANTGAVNIAGKLGDGTPFTVSGQLNTGGRTWTLFELLYAGKNPGSIEGIMTFENLGNSDCDGTLEWTKPPQTTGYYPGGFSATVPLMAAKYASPPLPLTSGTITMGGGDLSDNAINDNLMISTHDKVIVSGTNDVSVTLTPVTGAFSGKFLYPGEDKKTSFGGVIYQKPDPTGFGLFLGADQSGNVKITQ